jgi:hypothetical protein
MLRADVQMKRALKILHTLGSVGMMGGMAACLVLAVLARSRSPGEAAALHAGIDMVMRWLIFPSLPVCLASGLLAIAVHRSFQNAGWVWAKAATGVITLEGTFGLTARGREIASISARALAAQLAGTAPDAKLTAASASLEPLLRSERGALWVLLAVCAANVILGVWRPKFRRAPGRE